MFHSTICVLLCGGHGNRMSALLEGGVTKTTLKVANRTMISYQLETFAALGINELFCLVSSQKDHDAVLENAKLFPKMKANVLLLKNDDSNQGTALSLHELFTRKSLKGENVLVCSGDTFVSRDAVRSLFETYFTTKPLVSVLLAEKNKEAVKALFDDSESSADFVFLDKNGKTVLGMIPQMGVDETISVQGALKSISNFSLHTDLFDLHVYLIRRDVLSLINHKKTKISSLKYDLIPFLTKAQYRDDAKEILKEVLFPETQNKALITLPPVVTASVVTSEISARVNTYLSFLDVSKKIATGEFQFLPNEEHDGKKKNFVSAQANINKMTQVGQECIIGAQTEIGAKCALRSSIVGNNTKIGDNCKIVNSVLMENVSVEEGATITNSVVCSNVIIRKKANLSGSYVSYAVVVKEASQVIKQTVFNDDEDEDDEDDGLFGKV